jgi:hypothetical protein
MQLQAGRGVGLFCNIVKWSVAKHTADVYKQVKNLKQTAPVRVAKWGKSVEVTRLLPWGG